MAPIIPTHRPLMTPLRAAIAIAIGAVASSLFLVVGEARSEASSSPSFPANLACPQRTATWNVI